MSAAQITAVVVLAELTTSLAAGILCMTDESDPGDVLRAAGNNAAASICSTLELIAEGL
jgi:hypothetical protein